MVTTLSTGYALLALFVPPADIVLVFLTPLWPVALAALACLGLGLACMSSRSGRRAARA